MNDTFALSIAVAVLKCIYAPIKLFTKRKKKITIISRQSNTPSRDVALLCDFMRKNHSDIECVVISKAIKDGIVNKLGFVLSTVKQMYHIASSAVVVIDSYNIPVSVLKHKSGLKVIQMWHASTAIKKFGYQTLNEPAGHSSETAEVMQMHRNYDYVICAGPESGAFFCEGFNVEPDKLKFYCLPRFDVFSNEGDDSRKTFKSSVYEEYGLDNKKETILYVPTFRRGHSVDLNQIAEAVNFEKFNLVVKLHPIDAEKVSVPDGVVVADKKYDSYDWLRISDRIVTDYSAIGIEAMVTGNPVYFFTYDIEEYKKEVGLNIDPLLSFHWCGADSPQKLANLLELEYDLTMQKEVQARYISASTENCTARLAEFIMTLM